MCVSPGLAKNTYGTGCFMLQNTGERRSTRNNRLLSTVAWQAGGKTSMRSKAACSSAARSCSGCATAWGSSSARPRSKRSPRPCRTAAASTSFPRSPAWARRIGTRTRAARSSASHAARPPLTLRAPRSRASPSRSPISSKRCRDDSAIELPELRVDGGAAANDVLHAVSGRPARRPGRAPASPRRRRLALLISPAWQSASGTRPTRSPVTGSVDKRFEPAMSRSQADARRAEWREALNRSKNWIARGQSHAPP